MLSRFARVFLGLVAATFILSSLAFFHAPSRAYLDPRSGATFVEGGVEQDVLRHDSGVIMPKLENATAKAELGRATWRLLHTMTLRFPETPTQDERDALAQFFYLQARLYPCGDCAAHFQKLLAKYPPQTSSRKSASNWLCFMHNQVNERLGKAEFDCAGLGDVYDCGCGDDEKKARDPNTGAGLVRGGR